jgi:hypothetical protein
MASVRLQADRAYDLAQQLASLDQVLALKHLAHMGNGLTELCLMGCGKSRPLTSR